MTATGSPTRPSMTIGGDAVGGSAAFEVVDPATGEAFASAPDCSHAELDRAMVAAADAVRSWSRTDADARRDALARAAAVVEAAADELGELLTAEQGKPRHEAAREVAGCARWLRYFAELELERETLEDGVELVRRPLGVVAAIAPWNFPLLLAVWKVAPALRAGNTVVLKPSPFTPLATLRLGAVLADVLPPGVLNVVSGGDELGRWMVSHPVPRKVSFTGSAASGRQVAAAAAADLKRVTLELGGNDAAIVLDDAEPAAIAEPLFWAAFTNNGQICSAVKRVYAPRSRYDELVEALAEHARGARVGPGADPRTELGPVSNAPQLRRVAGLVEEALRDGARAVCGGGPLDRPGYFYAPTVLAGLDERARIVSEEQFGPALPVVAYDDLDDAVARANATDYGLSGSVWAGDPERGARVAARLECGTAWVNAHLALAPHLPFGGHKHSGIGVENGPWGLHEFTAAQVLHRAGGRS